MSHRVQAALTASGSLQHFGPIPGDLVARHVQAGSAFTLEAPPRIVGSVFVERVPSDRDHVVWRWGLDAGSVPCYFLEKLMIDPPDRGQGLGRVLLDAVRTCLTSGREIAVVLDCWAGNRTLRAYYERAGFHLHGIFPEGDYEIAVFVWRERGGRIGKLALRAASHSVPAGPGEGDRSLGCRRPSE